MTERDTSAVAVGKRLRQVRQMAGFTRNELAQKARVGRSSITYWEHAKSRPMSEKSLAKILSAVHAAGVECSAEWIKQGADKPPSLKSSLQPTLELPTSFTLPQEIGYLSIIDEMKLFMGTNPSAVIHKIEDDSMAPIFDKGDFVGGLWETNHTLHTEKICIVLIADKLHLRVVSPGSKENYFNLSILNKNSIVSDNETITDIKLDKIAPIIRFWR